MKRAALVFLLVVAFARAAHAQPAKARAREAYARGEAAFEREDYAAATDEFLVADYALPSVTAMKSALDAVARTDSAALAAHVLNRAAGRSEAALDAPRRTAEEKFEKLLGRLIFECRAAACSVSVDGKDVPLHRAIWLVPRAHDLLVTVDGAVSRRAITTVAAREQTVELAPAPSSPAAVPPPSQPAQPARPAPPAERRSASEAGISPTWFFVAAGVTVAVGAVATWSSLELLSTRSDFDDARCASVGGQRCRVIADRGESADVRTVVLAAATGALALGTAALGIFAVRWHDQRASAILIPGGGGLSIAGSFR